MYSSPTAFARHAAVLMLAGVLAACTQQTDEERGREAMKEMQKSTVDVEAIALAQPASPELVSEVQRHLTAIHEYQGEINGKIDSVTVNAIQSFQRTASLPDDGIINEATRKKLAAAAAGQGKS